MNRIAGRLSGIAVADVIGVGNVVAVVAAYSVGILVGRVAGIPGIGYVGLFPFLGFIGDGGGCGYVLGIVEFNSTNLGRRVLSFHCSFSFSVVYSQKPVLNQSGESCFISRNPEYA